MEDVTYDGLRKRVAELEQAHMAQARIAWHHYQRAEAAEALLPPLRRVAEEAYWSLIWTWQENLDGRPGPLNMDGLDPDAMPAVERRLYEALKDLRPFYDTEARKK